MKEQHVGQWLIEIGAVLIKRGHFAKSPVCNRLLNVRHHSASRAVLWIWRENVAFPIFQFRWKKNASFACHQFTVNAEVSPRIAQGGEFAQETVNFPNPCFGGHLRLD